MTRAWLFLLLTALLSFMALHSIELRTDIGDFFFTADSAAQSDRGLLAGRLQSDQLARRYLLSVGHAGVDSGTAERFVSAFQAELRQLPEVLRVWSEPFSQTDIKQTLRFYALHQRQLMSLQPQPAVARLFSDEGLSAQARLIKQAVLGPDPSLVKTLLAEDPMLLTLSWFRQVRQAYRPPAATPDHSAFFLESRSTGLDTRAQQQLQQQMAQRFATLKQQYGGQFSLQTTGVAVFATHIQAQVKDDINRISILSVSLIVLLSWLLFRSLRALLCINILLIATVSTAALTTQWLYGYVHGLTLALGTTLIGVCIDYFIHSMVHAGRLVGSERVAAIRRLWPVLLIGGATTLIGYTALSFSGFPGLQQVATFTGSGIITALLLSRFVLPELMSLLRVRVTPHIDLSWLLRLPVGRRSRWLIVAAVGALLLAGGNRLHWSDDLSGMAPSLQQLASNDRAIRTRLSSIEPGRFIIISAADQQAVLQGAEQVQRRLQELQRQGQLDAWFPLFPWLASERLQQQNQQAWNAGLNDQLRKRWRRALTGAGLSATAFPPLSEAQRPPLSPQQVMHSPIAELLSSQWLPASAGQTGASAIIWLGRHQAAAVRASLQHIPTARYFSQRDNIHALSRDYRNKAQTLLAWGLLAILAMLSLRYRSITTALRVLTPAALSLLLVLALWGLSGAAMGMLQLIGLLLTAAVCVDYGVFFVENSGGDRARTFQAISISAITTAAAFGSLGAAENPAMHALAWTVAPGVLFGFLLCPLMLGGREQSQ